MADKKLKFIIEGVDKASPAMRKVEGSAKRMGEGVSKYANIAKVGLVALATGAVAVAGASVKMAGDFEKSMANVSTLIDTGAESMDAMKDSVLEISKRTPVALEDLTSALYDVRSAGISAEDSMMILEKSAQLGVAGLGSTAEAVDIATSAINAFNLKGEEAAEVFDVIQATVKSGKTTISQLSQSFGLVAGTTKEAGVSFKELQAATAAMTTSGLKASVAQNGIRQAILALTAPTKDMAGLIADMGFESGQAMVKEKGLVESLRLVKEATGGSAEQMKKAFGSVEALGVALSLAGEQSDEFDSIMRDMADSAGILSEAFAKQKETFASQYQELKNNLGAVLIKLGTVILPVLNKAIQAILPVIDKMTAWFSSSSEGGEEMSEVMKSLADLVKNYIVPVLGAGFETIKSLVSLFKIAWENDFFAIKEITSAVFGALLVTIKTALTVISGLFKSTTALLSGDWKGFVDGMGESGMKIIELNKGWISKTADIWSDFFIGLHGSFEQGWNNNRSTTAVALGLIADDISSAFMGIADLASGFYENFSEGWNGFWNGVKLFLIEIWNTIIKTIEVMINKAIDLINKLIDSINRALGRFGVHIPNLSHVSMSGAMVDTSEGMDEQKTEGKRANGGAVSGGKPYLVGERGAEVFVPNGKGQIIPNGSLGGVTINITGNNIDSSDRVQELADAIDERLSRQMNLQKFGVTI